jgi:hypothetical protein
MENELIKGGIAITNRLNTHNNLKPDSFKRYNFQKMMSTVKFDTELLAEYRKLGYCYFCADVLLPSSKNTQDGLVRHWTLIPFKTKEEFLNMKGSKNFLRHPLIDNGIIDEIAGGLPDVDAVVMVIDAGYSQTTGEVA